MPLRAHHVQSRRIATRLPSREPPDVPFDDLVYLLAESVADAQQTLDVRTVETIETLAETTVDVVPSVTRTITADGTVTTETAATESRSLLELGLTPSRYQFREATVEVEVDIGVTETEASDEERTGRPYGLRADTRSVTERRTYDREVTANARLAATLEPTPLPAAAEPAERREEPDGGTRADGGLGAD
jgi:hypothetical protein